MFRRLISFVFLVLALVVMVPVAPAQAQDDQPIDMLENVVLAPDACSPGCLGFSIYVTCGGTGNLPPNQGSSFYFAELTGPYTRGRLVPYTTNVVYDGKHWRVYSFLEENHPTGAWSGKWKRMSGPFAGWWSSTLGPYQLNSGGAVAFTFYSHDWTIC